MRSTPSNIVTLAEHEIFVFGSNERGAHWAGAARLAYERFGAEWGVARGRTGQSYGIVSMVTTLPQIGRELAVLMEYAVERIFTKSRLADVVLARHIAMFLARQNGVSLHAIGRYFQRDHSTVVHAMRSVKSSVRDFSRVLPLSHEVGALATAQAFLATMCSHGARTASECALCVMDGKE